MLKLNSVAYDQYHTRISKLFELQDPRPHPPSIIGRTKRRLFRELLKRMLRRYSRFVLANSEARGYFTAKLYLDDRMTGEEYLNGKAVDSLARTMQAFLAKGGHFPNLLNPSRFSEFLLLYKVLGRVPTPSPEDKLRNITYLPKEVEHLLTKHYRPFITETPRLPEVGGIEPGHYWLKTNYGCGHNARFKFPPNDADLEKIENLVSSWLGKRYYTIGGVWWDELVSQSVYLERHLGDHDCEVHDWKFYVFYGRVEIVQVDVDRIQDHKQNVYDRSFTPIEEELYFERGSDVVRPKRYDDMVAVAEAIGSNFDFVRVDLFSVDKDVFLGEIGLAPNGARSPIRSDDLDKRLGLAWSNGAAKHLK